MKKMKKLICLLCAVLFLVSSLTACQSKTEHPAGTAEGSGTTKEPEATNAPEITPVVNEPKQELPIANGDITLTVGFPVASKVEDMNTNKLTLYIEEQTGINLEFVELAEKSEDTATQINSIMNGGTLPDVFVGYDFPYDTLCSYADAGLLLPLDEYVDEWGYNLKNTIMADSNFGERVLSYTTYDGHVWAMPSGGALMTNVYGKYLPRIQGAFLYELGLELPKTLDEFRDFLAAVHEKYPDVIPFTSYASENYIFSNISQAFQYTDEKTYLKLNGDQVEFIANNEEFKAAIEYAKEMVDDGLIDPAAFTQDKSVLATFCAQDGNNVAALGNGYFVNQAIDSSSEEYYEVLVMGVLEGPNGYASVQLDSAPVRRSMVITSACEHPEEAFRLFDFFLSDEFAIAARVGVEGEQWEKAADGVVGRDGSQAWFSLLTAQEWSAASTNVLWRNERFIHSSIMNHCEMTSANQRYPFAEQIEALQLADYVTGEKLPQLVMSVEDTTEYNELQELIVDNVNANVAQFILGNRDIAEWDQFCAELESMGVDRYVDLAQAAYTDMIN